MVPLPNDLILRCKRDVVPAVQWNDSGNPVARVIVSASNKLCRQVISLLLCNLMFPTDCMQPL